MVAEISRDLTRKLELLSDGEVIERVCLYPVDSDLRGDDWKEYAREFGRSVSDYLDEVGISDYTVYEITGVVSILNLNPDQLSSICQQGYIGRIAYVSITNDDMKEIE
jgi:hypothetical protein